jgi:hypothetical protein
MLVEEILAISPLLEAVESTCRKIRQDATFVPSIGEFMKVLKVENDLWQDRFTAIYSPIYMLFGSYRDDLEELARRGITTARNGLGDLPDDVRVRHWKHGSGAVVSSSRSQVGVIFDGEDDDESLWIPRALLELEFALEHKPVETLVIGAKVPVSVGGDGDEF